MKIIILDNMDRLNMDTILEVKKIDYCPHATPGDCGTCEFIPTCKCICRLGGTPMLYHCYNKVHGFHGSICEHSCCILEE